MVATIINDNNLNNINFDHYCQSFWLNNTMKDTKIHDKLQLFIKKYSKNFKSKEIDLNPILKKNEYGSEYTEHKYTFQVLSSYDKDSSKNKNNNNNHELCQLNKKFIKVIAKKIYNVISKWRSRRGSKNNDKDIKGIKNKDIESIESVLSDIFLPTMNVNVWKYRLYNAIYNFQTPASGGVFSYYKYDCLDLWWLYDYSNTKYLANGNSNGNNDETELEQKTNGMGKGKDKDKHKQGQHCKAVVIRILRDWCDVEW